MIDDVEGLDDACRRVYPRLVGALSLYCGDRQVAEELAQETLVRLWQRWGSVNGSAAVDAWTYRVAINLANSRFRRRRAEQRAQARLGARPADNPDPAAALAIREAFAALPRRQRQALVLRFYGGLTVEETAELMGCAPGTVKAHVHKTVEGLRASGLVDEEVSVDA